MNERILIVGGTGFIGRHLVNAAIAQSYECSVLSLHAPAVESRIEGVIYLQADLTNLDMTIATLSEYTFEYVVNLSGYIDHSPLFDGGRKVIGAHFTGVKNIIQALNRTALKCFVQVGSSDEYGNLPSPQQESMREAPISPYSLAKMASTQLLQMLHRTEGFPAVIVRLFLVYGEGQGDKRFLPQIIQGCLEDRSFPVSEGEQLRDFCHVSDISRGIMFVLNEEKAQGEVINLASGVPVSIRAMIEKVQHKIGKGDPQFGEVAYRSGENMELFADTTKASDMLGWQPENSMDDGLHRTIEYYRTVTGKTSGR